LWLSFVRGTYEYEDGQYEGMSIGNIIHPDYSLVLAAVVVSTEGKDNV
jgi:hypothetical protein